MKKYLFYTLIWILGFGCSQKKADKISFDIKQDIDCISIPYDDILGVTMQIIRKDSLLFINDFNGDSLIVTYNVNNNQIERKLISVGNGPNELISPLEIYIENSNLLIFCRRMFTLYTVPLESLSEKDINLRKLFQVPTEVSRLYPITDSTFVCSGFFEERYALLNNKGEVIREFGDYPDLWGREVNIPTSAKAMFHQTAFVKHPTAPMFISYSSHIIEIYEYKNDPLSPQLIKTIPLGDYNYTYTTGNTISAPKGADVEKGVTDVACSSDYIYIVYNLSKNANENSGSQIMVIDWQGTPIKVLNTKKNISCLSLDEEDKKAHCIIKDLEDTLAYFYL